MVRKVAFGEDDELLTRNIIFLNCLSDEFLGDTLGISDAIHLDLRLNTCRQYPMSESLRPKPLWEEEGLSLLPRPNPPTLKSHRTYIQELRQQANWESITDLRHFQASFAQADILHPWSWFISHCNERYSMDSKGKSLFPRRFALNSGCVVPRHYPVEKKKTPSLAETNSRLSAVCSSRWRLLTICPTEPVGYPLQFSS